MMDQITNLEVQARMIEAEMEECMERAYNNPATFEAEQANALALEPELNSILEEIEALRSSTPNPRWHQSAPIV